MQGPGIYDGVAPSRGITPGRALITFRPYTPWGIIEQAEPREIRVSLTTDTSLVKRSMAAIAVVGLLLLTACSSGSSAVSTVDAQSFLSTASQAGVTVIDVRTPEEYAAGHLDGAVNMNVEGPDFGAQIATLDTAGTVAVYCRSGRRSAAAADQLAGAGFTTIVNLDGGLADLQSAGGSIVSG